jgi:hypothetical protein
MVDVEAEQEDDGVDGGEGEENDDEARRSRAAAPSCAGR